MVYFGEKGVLNLNLPKRLMDNLFSIGRRIPHESGNRQISFRVLRFLPISHCINCISRNNQAGKREYAQGHMRFVRFRKEIGRTYP